LDVSTLEIDTSMLRRKVGNQMTIHAAFVPEVAIPKLVLFNRVKQKPT